MLFHALAYYSLGWGEDVAELHIRASQWYEGQGLDIEAFHHAVAANDVRRAARLVEAECIPSTDAAIQKRNRINKTNNTLKQLKLP